MRGIKRNVWKESSEINSRYISKGYKYNTPEHAAKPNVASTLHSGRIADAMGEIIASLSARMQVVDITHLPQVASKGTAHFVVYKRDGRTSITRLSEGERVTEIAKMLSGSEITDAAVAQARILLGRRETEAQPPREAAPAAPKGKESGLLF